MLLVFALLAMVQGLKGPQMIECAASSALDLDIVGDGALSSLE
nr:hypothetical protein [Labrenzia sp. CE80]